VTVGVVDTGIELAHNDLAGQIATNPGESGGGREGNGVDDDHDGFVDDYRGWDWVDNDNTPADAYGHGTHVAGTIAALTDNGIGIAGVAPQAKVMPLRALDATGSGSDSDVAAAFAYAGRLGLPVVNASLGGGFSQAIEDAIAAHPSTLYVVAAGNDGADDDAPATAEYPCAYPLPNIVCVGASDNADQPASFSNYGATSVDLFAPGVNVLSTYDASPSSYVLMSGTSMATPHVAGAAALVLAADPGISVAQVKHALLSSVDPRPALAGLSVSGGRLNAAAAVASVAGVAPDPAPTPTATPVAPAPVVTPPPVSTPAPVVTPAPVSPPAPVATPAPGATPRPPVLSHLHVHGSLRTPGSRLRVTFSVSRAASVRFTVLRHGAPRASGTWIAHARTGANAFTLSRRLPTHRTLAPGAYSLRVSLAATASAARFTVR
jgi:subtilisin family serine protease